MEPSLQAGDALVVAQLGLCAGGLVRTGSDGGGSRLWSVDQPELLRRLQATDQIDRTPREERRYREVGLLSEATGTLIVQSRFPAETDEDSAQLEAQMFALTPAGEPGESAIDDVVVLIKRAIAYAADSQEFLFVELGGWDAPQVPFCLFVLAQEENGLFSIVETNPIPQDAEFWSSPSESEDGSGTMWPKPLQTRSRLLGSSSWNRSPAGRLGRGTWH
ncbi:MAG: hypothetical protein ACOYD0_06060 [Candidatus Nanopelagicales bacterium]